MRLHILSDIHLEFGKFKYTPPECDVAIYAGDTHPGVKGIMWIGEQPAEHKIAISGNHEMYGQGWKRHLPRHYKKLYIKAEQCGVTFLQNETTIIDGVRFIGCTLWTDYNLYGNQYLAMVQAQLTMNDFKEIYIAPKHLMLPENFLDEHKKSKTFIIEELSKPFAGKTVVITHHAPSEKSCLVGADAKFSYASNLEDLIRTFEPNVWVHGHTHVSRDYMIDKTRVICNPRGYCHDPNKLFNPQFVLDI